MIRVPSPAAWLRISAIVLPLSLTGCVILPIPYHTVRHSTIMGRLVDVDTGLPVVGAHVRLESTSAGETASATNGYFLFKASEAEGTRFDNTTYLWSYEFPVGDYLLIDHPDYRPMRIFVNSATNPRLKWHSEHNRFTSDEVGDIALKKLPVIPVEAPHAPAD